MEVDSPDDLRERVETDISNFRNIPQLRERLIRDRLLLVSKDTNHPLIKEIDKLLQTQGILCSELYQINISKDVMERMVSRQWRPLLGEKRIGCGLNVLSFLGIMQTKSARAKITCMDVDTGFTMTDIQELIAKKEASNKNNAATGTAYSYQIYKTEFNIDTLKRYVFDQLNQDSATIVRGYLSTTTAMGHTMALYRHGSHLYLLDPQQEAYGELKYTNDTFELEPLMGRPMDASHRHMLDFIRKCVAFEFIGVNKKISAIKPAKKASPFVPLLMTEETPFHMFLLVSHGTSVYADTHKETLKFPFHSMGFYVEKNLVLSVDAKRDTIDIETVIEEVADSMKRVLPNMQKQSRQAGERANPKLANVIINATGKIEVYPMYWYVNPRDIDSMKQLMGLYHYVYDKSRGVFTQVEEIFGYNYFIDRNTGESRKLYYSDIIRKCNDYYDRNREKYFKQIPRELIYVGIFSCRSPDIEYLTSESADQLNDDIETGEMEVISETEEMKARKRIEREKAEESTNIFNLKRYFKGITSGGFATTEKTVDTFDIDMVSQDELFRNALENRKAEEQRLRYRRRKRARKSYKIHRRQHSKQTIPKSHKKTRKHMPKKDGHYLHGDAAMR